MSEEQPLSNVHNFIEAVKAMSIIYDALEYRRYKPKLKPLKEKLKVYTEIIGELSYDIQSFIKKDSYHVSPFTGPMYNDKEEFEEKKDAKIIGLFYRDDLHKALGEYDLRDLEAITNDIELYSEEWIEKHRVSRGGGGRRKTRRGRRGSRKTRRGRRGN